MEYEVYSDSGHSWSRLNNSEEPDKETEVSEDPRKFIDRPDHYSAKIS